MRNKRTKSLWWIVLIGLVNIIFVLLGVRGYISAASVVIIIGVFSFFSTLALANFFSENDKLMKGEMRKAMATSLLMVYFTVLALTLVDSSATLAFSSPGADGMKTTIIGDFSTLMAVVVGFYFGGRSAEEIIKSWKGEGENGGNGNNSNNNDEGNNQP